MRFRMFPHSIRAKFLVVGLTAVLMVGAVSLILTGAAQRLLRQQSQTNAVDLAKQMAFVAGPLIAFDSRNELTKALELLSADPDFAYARVSDQSGTPLVALGRADAAPCVAGPDLQVVSRGGFLHITTPVMDGGVKWGCLQLGTSLERSERDVETMRTIAYGATALTMLVMMMSGMYLSRSIVSPVTRLADAAGRVGRGEWDAAIDVHARDEVGVLADSFRTMLAELRRTTVSKTYVDDIIHSMADSLVVFNAAHIIERANRATYALLGYDEGTLVGEPLERITAAQEPSDLAHLTTLEAGSLQVDTDYIARDGQRIPVRVSTAPMHTDGRHVICVAQDMRERQRAQRELLASKEKAESANRAKSTFLANMSHEIRTPLNAILGYSQLMLRDTAIGRDAKDNLEIINRSGEHLLALINDVLDMSKIEAGGMTRNLVTFDLAVLLADLTAMFRLKAQGKGLTFDVFVDANNEQCIVADEGKIRQLLINLVGNAVKFTERGGVKVRVAMDRRSDGQLWLSARVEDTGVGVAPAEQDKLFQPFSQTQSGLKLQGGTGLGLAISAEYVRLMGGRITMSSEAEVGTVLSFDIPVQPGDAASAVSRTPYRRVIGLQPGPAPRVLIADDETNNRGWLNKLLTSIGFAVREAENGEVAIRIWEEWKPQLILMDIRMPVMDGVEATRRIRKNPAGAGTVIIVLTASAMDEDRRIIMQTGVDDFISKPCREGELFEKIRVHLGLAYTYADRESLLGAESIDTFSASMTLGAARRLPVELAEEMRRAILSGEKFRLDELIGRIPERDTQFAQALQGLANEYEYDTLTQLLDEAAR
jgi:PAS domain S-box-containing protein